jgi:hypothetical protein
MHRRSRALSNVVVRCPMCVVRRGRALSDMFTRRPPWSRVVCRGHASCIVHRRSWPVRRCLSVVAHHSSPIAPPWLSVIRRGWSWLVVAHHPSIVHHRRSSIHRPSSLLVRHRVIGRLTSSCAVHHHWSCIVGRRWSAAVERRPSASGPSTVDGQCGEGESSQRRGKWGMKLSSYQDLSDRLLPDCRVGGPSPSPSPSRRRTDRLQLQTLTLSLPIQCRMQMAFTIASTARSPKR